ncbi:hypothetical protein [Ulvibacter litoralis]|uniref:Uncharacterized protein n=1 Tax=Ulvibacter litoralis TaxID=227084 RepID=A0A1G7FEG6_9FLAO|nr:hypothetical protein [Ulvibacter litoralis]GHC51484.1 hypothetical protein GCM10008083_13970 [Ulvibacter litoralis]SDE74274.1 hypothetical protein SAMN05421855_102509 [Ulvibacter litoralis]
MKNTTLYILFFVVNLTVYAQVGINTSSPSATLDVVGNVKTDLSLFLENPGEYTQIRDSKLLIKSTTDEVLKYNLLVSKYGPTNYAEYVFKDLSTNGLQDYDTKIATSEYIVTVQGFYFVEAITGNTDIMSHSNIRNNNIEGHQIYAYKNTTTNTWFLRGFINNGTFRSNNGSAYVDSPIDLYLNVIIYRNGFITKEQSGITVDMGNSETGVAPLPSGF